MQVPLCLILGRNNMKWFSIHVISVPANAGSRWLTLLALSKLKSVQIRWHNRLDETVQITRYNVFSCHSDKENYVHNHIQTADFIFGAMRCFLQNVIPSCERRLQRFMQLSNTACNGKTWFLFAFPQVSSG